jgi:hypothetical protein
MLAVRGGSPTAWRNSKTTMRLPVWCARLARWRPRTPLPDVAPKESIAGASQSNTDSLFKIHSSLGLLSDRRRGTRLGNIRRCPYPLSCRRSQPLGVTGHSHSVSLAIRRLTVGKSVAQNHRPTKITGQQNQFLAVMTSHVKLLPD